MTTEYSVRERFPAISSQPFFVLGAQRSGTTMLRLMLNSHSRLSVPFETGFIPAFYKRLEEFGTLQEQSNIVRLLDAIAAHPPVVKGKLITDKSAILGCAINSYSDLVQSIFMAYARTRNKPRWGDKSPVHVTQLDILWELFPNAKFVHIVRDGRDVALSLSGISWGSDHIPRVAEDWRWKVTLCSKMGAMLGKQHYMQLRYEDLVLDPETSLRCICDFLGEPFVYDMLEYHKCARQEMPLESLQWHENSVSKPNKSKVFSWKARMSLADRILFEEIAGSTLTEFGYEVGHHAHTLSSMLKKVKYYTIKRW